MRKNSFLLFISSLIPGAGEMYLGMMKTGAITMSVFFGIIMLGGFFRIQIIFFALPVIWFYSFFTVHNNKHLAPEWLKQMDDHTLVSFSNLLKKDGKHLINKRHSIIGILLILIGGYALYDILVSPYYYVLRKTAPFLYRLLSNLPTLIVSLAVIGLGIFLLSGSKAKSEAGTDEDTFTEYGGNKHE